MRLRRPAAGASPRTRPWIREALWTLGTGLVALTAAIVSCRLWRADLHTPIVDPGGDYIFGLAIVKSVVTHGWGWYIPELGAPFGLNLFDFPTIFGDYLHFGLWAVLSLFTQNSVLVYNLFMVAGFPLAAMAAFWVQRDLGVTRPVALVTSVVFATLPFHFGPLAWSLTAYYAVPFVVWLVMLPILGRPVWTMHGRVPLPTLKVAIALFIVAGASVYWMVFCGVLLVVCSPVVALVRTSWRPLLRGAVIAVMVGTMAVVAQAPSLIYHVRNGSNEHVGVRYPYESEIYGLKLAALVIPSRVDPVPILARVGARYDSTTSLPAEGVWNSYLGVLGSIGLLLGVGWLLRFGLRESRILPEVGFVSLAAMLVASIGGVSTLIAWYLSSQIRGWDRMCVVIGFTALLSLALVLDDIGRRLKPKLEQKHRSAIGGGLALLLVFAVYEQTPTGAGRTAVYSAWADAWRSQTRYTAAVVDRLPKRDASVLQLPYFPFPENGPKLSMGDYEQLRPFAQTTAPVEWSGGAMKGRSTDWGPEIANLSASELVDRAAAAGFDGIWLDRRAYADSGVALRGEISKALGGQKPFNSPDGTISFFNLRSFEREESARYTRKELRLLANELIHPLTVDWGVGFGEVEQNDTSQWHWLGVHGKLTIDNPTATWRKIVLTASAYRAIETVPSSVSLVAPTRCRRTLPVAAGGSRARFTCKIPPGDTQLEFSTMGPAVPVDANQPRADLHVRLADPQWKFGDDNFEHPSKPSRGTS
jgi:phosphoglycerol transferase